MAEEFDCMTGDDGICSIPDPAVVVVGGHVRAATSSEVDRLLASESMDDLNVEAVRAMGVEEVDAFGLRDRVDEPTDDGVIATCTCGHIYIIRSEKRL